MMNIFNFLFQVKNFLFPADCALCGRSLIFTQEIKQGLCEECAAGLNLPDGSKCEVCGKPLLSEIGQCLPCRNGEKRSFDRQWVLFPYMGKFRKIMTEYKFRKNLALAGFFAEKIISLLSEGILKDACIVPVPPRPGKIKANGWDQVDYLVKRLYQLSGKKINICRCLRRRKSKIQKYLNRKERMENLKGKIYVDGAVPKIAVIIDDVTTTGSTMEVCASVLKDSGAEIVYGLCLFYD